MLTLSATLRLGSDDILSWFKTLSLDPLLVGPD